VTVCSKSNADATEYVISVKEGVESAPFDIGLMIGEIAHHARGVLDWLAWSIATNPGESTTFPIWSHERTAKNGQPIKPTISGGLSPSAAQFVERVQPYVAWSSDPTASPLHWLHEMDRIDKHRHLIPTACSDSGYLRKVSGDIHGTVETDDLRSELKTGKPIARITLSEPNPDLDFDYQPVPYVSVDGIAPSLDELNIGVELAIAIDVVRLVVIEFAGAGLLLR
jgi:hypothetical protein